MAFNVWLAFVAASVALLLIPGPTVLLVLSYAISQGKRVAMATVVGVVLGDFIAMTASLAGLGALVLASATLFTVLKWVGALYLVYLGINMFRSASEVRLGGLSDTPRAGVMRVFGHAVTVTALNPKSIVFFIAFVPQFVAPTAPLAPQFAILIATFLGLAGVNALVYALLGGGMRRRIAKPFVLPLLTRLGGTALIGMGIATAAVRRSS